MGLVLNLADTLADAGPLPAGIEIVTWAQRPDLARGMYEVDVESRPDIPGFEDVAVEPFEHWMAHLMERPTDSPERRSSPSRAPRSLASQSCRSPRRPPPATP